MTKKEKSKLKKAKKAVLLEKIEDYCYKVDVINDKRTVLGEIRTQKELAGAIGVSTVTLTSVMTDINYNPRLNTMESFAEVLECNYWDIF